MRALGAAALAAMLAMTAPQGATAAGDRPNAKAAYAYRTAIMRWARSVAGDPAAVPSNLLNVEPEGDHYVFSFPALQGTALSERTVSGLPLRDGRWELTGLRLRSPFEVWTELPSAAGGPRRASFDGTFRTWETRTMLDPTGRTASGSTSSLAGLQVAWHDRTATKADRGHATMEAGTAGWAAGPVADGVMDASARWEATGLAAEGTPADGRPAAQARLGRLRLAAAAAGISTATLAALPGSAWSAWRAAAVASGRPAGGEPRESQAGAALQAAARLLPALLRGLEAEAAIEDATATAGGLRLAIGRGSASVAAKQDGATLSATASLDLGSASDADAEADRDASGTRIAASARVGGVSAETAYSLVEEAAETGTVEDGVARLLAGATMEGSVEAVAMDLGGARFDGVLAFGVDAAGRKTATGRIVARNLNSLRRSLAADPATARIGAAVALAAGYGRQDGDDTVWDIRTEGGAILANGVGVIGSAASPSTP